MSVLQEVTRKAKDYVQCRYGNLLSLDKPIFNEKEKIWSVKLQTDYPRLILNDNPEERVVRTLRIKDLGTLFFNQDLKLLKDYSTSRTDCLDFLKTRLKTRLASHASRARFHSDRIDRNNLNVPIFINLLKSSSDLWFCCARIYNKNILGRLATL